MLYVIPFVILLIVLVVLKKRQDAQGSEKSTATTATQKSKAKKASSSAKVAPNKTQAVQDSVVEKKQTTPLSAETRNKIESLIQERNFFSAEAQINQVLKRDNSQHELYLYLLDIHILQKDEFAISQLLNHVRSLELDDILAQAEAKKAEFDKSQHKSDEAIAFVSPTINPEPAAAAPKAQNTADFDALMAGSAAPAEPKADLAFEQLEPPTAPKPVQQAAEEIQPLEFNLSFDSAPKAATPAQEPAPSIDFGSFSLEEAAPAAKAKPEAPAQEEIQPLDFSLNLAPAAKTEPEAPAQAEIQPLDFSFSVDAPLPVEKPENASPLSFDLNSLDAAAAETPAAAKPAQTGVNFDISSVSSPSAAPADSSDPLIQSFPALAESNDIEVNLELAQQYIKLGAFDAARELLAEKETEYSTEQRQQADLLLNQIAS
ncbi:MULTISPECIES: fimbrial protein FimV [Acinetobacter]|uniref:Fimbrial protein FimV n=2 Tax=Acinetobacter TaxID=469 RepID=A0A4Q7B3T7_9GAMM|nr:MULTISPECIES: fimbrial protein FimV [Acinetobacter]MCW8038607.1 fimbrial protein FimV [Acinetobacter entericus]RZG69869.1 fimbrial protein FimV [Acinetobacter bouvetii]TCB74912.1 fimbrial protein FimV [Acinetobacter sp. ANC 4177]